MNNDDNKVTDPRAAGTLILKNLGMFNQAAILFEKTVTKDIFYAINLKIANFKKNDEWHIEGELECNSDYYVQFALQSWKVKDEESEYYCYFDLDSDLDKDDESSSYDIANLCGCGDTRTGFFVKTNTPNYFGGTRKWKSITKSATENKVLEDSGFVLSKNGYCFLPVTLDIKKLAEAYGSEDYTEALKPINDAFEKLVKAAPILDKIIQQAITENQ